MQCMRKIAQVSYFVHFQRWYTFNNIMQQFVMQCMRKIAQVSYFVHVQQWYTFNNIMQQYAMQCMRKNSKKQRLHSISCSAYKTNWVIPY